VKRTPTQRNTVGMKVSKMSQQTVPICPILIRLLRLVPVSSASSRRQITFAIFIGLTKS